MSIAEQYIDELTSEAATTRRALERVPEEKLSWRPHPKSMSMGQLAHHISVLPHGITDLVSQTTTEAPIVPRPEATSVKELLAAHDDSIAYATRKIAGWSDADMAATWTMTREGNPVLQFTRGEVLRSVLLNHIVHHRAQLGLYFRLLDIPVPGTYGPTADENPFG